jgi:hypothetical protein
MTPPWSRDAAPTLSRHQHSRIPKRSYPFTAASPQSAATFGCHTTSVSSRGSTGRPSIPAALAIDREAATYWITRFRG